MIPAVCQAAYIEYLTSHDTQKEVRDAYLWVYTAGEVTQLVRSKTGLWIRQQSGSEPRVQAEPLPNLSNHACIVRTAILVG